MKLYLAGPLFTIAEKNFNTALAYELESRAPWIHVDLPQERAKQFLGTPTQNEDIFADCVESVRNADVIVAVLEGPDIDSGTAVELGLAIANSKPVFGIRTDFRISEERGLNLMVAFACTVLFLEPTADIATLAESILDFCTKIERPIGSDQEYMAAIRS